MVDGNTSPDDRYEAIVATLLEDDRVAFDASGKGFGASALKTGGKIFAMLVHGRLVVKLPRQRVECARKNCWDEVIPSRPRSQR